MPCLVDRGDGLRIMTVPYPDPGDPARHPPEPAGALRLRMPSSGAGVHGVEPGGRRQIGGCRFVMKRQPPDDWTCLGGGPDLKVQLKELHRRELGPRRQLWREVVLSECLAVLARVPQLDRPVARAGGA